jgi:hypothetical protein
MLSVIMLNVVMLNVVAPYKQYPGINDTWLTPILTTLIIECHYGQYHYGECRIFLC